MTPRFLIWSISTNIPKVLANFLGIHNPVFLKNIGRDRGNTISSIIALITYVKEPHQFSLAWCELVVCKGFIPRLVIFFEVFTMPPWLEQCQHCSTVVLSISCHI